ncbi:cell cycle control protein [Anaeramoeba flamelloides]|uniref:Cell cycle control protein n=1 Tax=Anaeramoeba flamelloides TaxID=1746091 RepID=A0AAV7ZI23_9EUKA|nr:cell cycle control protein [Anaeramoeba flamelloides]
MSEQPPKNKKKNLIHAFKQQELNSWKPILRPRIVIPILFVTGIIFLITGFVLLMQMMPLQTVSTRYDDQCMGKENCEITFEIKETMKKPVYFYYELTNFHQNHRRFLKSRCDSQLRGEDISFSDIADCQPLQSRNNKKDYKYIYKPCGLISWNTFNDTYSLMTESKNNVSFTSEGISWNSDVGKKFKNPTETLDPMDETVIQSDYTDEHFIVWMRVESLPNFRKLYGIIKDNDLEKGTYTAQIENNFNSTTFHGTKSLVFLTTTWTGSRNYFISLTYMSAGIFLIVIGIAFLIKHLVSPRNLGDLKLIDWYND